MYKRLAVLAAAMAASSVQANDFSSTVTFVSDYLFNGYSQTNSNPAMQLSLDYSHDGWYAGLWTSDVDFDALVDTEVDGYAGYNGKINDIFSYEVGVAYYYYTGVESELNYDYGETYAGLTAWENSTVKVWYSDDYFGATGKAWVLRLQQMLPINDRWKLKGQVNKIQHEDFDTYWLGTEDGYVHWQLGVLTSLHDLNFELSFSDTNLDSKDDVDDVADSTVLFSVAKTFTY